MFLPEPTLDSRTERPPKETRNFHPFLNGTISSTLIFQSDIALIGLPCNQDGDPIPPDAIPPPKDAVPNVWDPFETEVQFRVADFLYRKVQMSQSDIDLLMELWALSMA